MKKQEKQMETKKLLVSFILAVSFLMLAVAGVNAQLANTGSILVEVDGIDANDSPAIVAGESVSVRVEFTALTQASDVTVEVEIESDKESVRSETTSFDVEADQRYVRTLKLDVPYDLKDELSDELDLNVKISGDGLKTETSYVLRVQREPFNADVLSVSVPQTVKAGELFPVDIVLKNKGYNNLDDVFVAARISALDVERTLFFGDLVALECDEDLTSVENYGVDVDRKCNEDNVDTASGRLFLQVPYDAKTGVYALEVKVENDDTVSSQTVQVVVENAFSEGYFIVSGNHLLIVNPTNELVVYRLVPQSTPSVSVSVSESLVAVPAGSSKTVTVDASSGTDGAQTYSVNVFTSDGALVDTVTFSRALDGTGSSGGNLLFVLTVILAIIFIVLLVVLIVLVGKKPEKSSEYEESYY